jgi:hemoglobin-like flavoprotein
MSLNIELLESSFEQIKEREAEFTSYFYTRLFADYPQVEPLFANTNMEEQTKKLFKSLILVVDNLRQPDVLTNALQGLGTRHVEYGVLPAHYPIVGNTLLSAFSTCLQDAWTPETKQAWTDAYTAVTELMLAGTDYPADILNPHTRS